MPMRGRGATVFVCRRCERITSPSVDHKAAAESGRAVALKESGECNKSWDVRSGGGSGGGGFSSGCVSGRGGDGTLEKPDEGGGVLDDNGFLRRSRSEACAQEVSLRTGHEGRSRGWESEGLRTNLPTSPGIEI